MAKQDQKKPLSVICIHLLITIGIVACILVGALSAGRILSVLLNSGQSLTNGALGLIFATFAGYILWTLNRMVKYRMAAVRPYLVVLVLATAGFLIFASSNGPMYQRRIEEWREGTGQVNPYSDAYQNTRITIRVVICIVGIGFAYSVGWSESAKSFLSVRSKSAQRNSDDQRTAGSQSKGKDDEKTEPEERSQ